MEKKVKLLKSHRRFSEDFKRKIVTEYEQGSLSVVQLSRLYNVSNVQIYNWIYKFSKPFFDKEKKRYLTNSYPRREINIVHYTGYKYDDLSNFKN